MAYNFHELISMRTDTLLGIYFNVIMESHDFKTALEVALQFFPGIKLKRENRNCASKACLQTISFPESSFSLTSGWKWSNHFEITKEIT